MCIENNSEQQNKKSCVEKNEVHFSDEEVDMIEALIEDTLRRNRRVLSFDEKSFREDIIRV